MDVLTDTARDLDNLDLSLTAPGVEAARRARASLVAQIRDHVLPRLADADIPAIVVVGGSTGAGKSTLVNSILGAEVSEAGVLRPTTRVPVLVVNPEDAQSLADHPVTGVSRLVTSDAVPAGLALVDASDLDSVQEANRTLASRLLEAADLWLFVTTAARYGDQTPWTTLEEAARRRTSIAVVLNRIPASILAEVRTDLVARLAGLGLSESPLFIVPDAGPHEGLLTASSVAELRTWLQLLAGRHRAAGLVRRTGRAQWTALRAELTQLAEDVDTQADAAAALEAETRILRQSPTSDLARDVELGSCGEGAPTTRWLTSASAGGPLASLAQGGRLGRGWFGRATRSRAAALAELAVEVRACVASRLEATVVAASDDATRVWQEAGAGTAAERLLPRTVDAVDVLRTWSDSVTKTTVVAPKGLTPGATADLLIAAAAGVEGARGAAERLGLGQELERAQTSLTQALGGALAVLLPEGAAASLAPDPSLAAALRLRASELAPFAQPGGTGGIGYD